MRVHDFRFLHDDGIVSRGKARLLDICGRQQDVERDLPKTYPGRRDGNYRV